MCIFEKNCTEPLENRVFTGSSFCYHFVIIQVNGKYCGLSLPCRSHYDGSIRRMNHEKANSDGSIDRCPFPYDRMQRQGRYYGRCTLQ